MSQPTTLSHLTPQQIVDDLWGAWKTQTLIAGIELEVFTHIAAGKRTAKDVARAAKASLRGMKRLLDALVGLGYLTKKGDRYGLHPVADLFLVRTSERYVGGMAYSSKLVGNVWSHLTDAVRSGQPVHAVDGEKDGKEFFPKLVGSIFSTSFGAAKAAANALPEKTRSRIKNVLDVAAGSAAWSLAFAQAIPDARVTVLDFPEVVPVARQFVERFGLTDRYDYLEGNLREVNFGRGCYDLVILGHIIHSEGEKWGRKLIQKSRRALRDGGMLLIGEFVPNDTRPAPPVPLMFALNMLLHTTDGNVFTMREYRQWLKDAGFKKVTTIDAPAPSPLILATA